MLLLFPAVKQTAVCINLHDGSMMGLLTVEDSASHGCVTAHRRTSEQKPEGVVQNLLKSLLSPLESGEVQSGPFRLVRFSLVSFILVQSDWCGSVRSVSQCTFIGFINWIN